MTFSFRPRRPSRLSMIAASVSTRVVSWNDAAEMNESVDSDALVKSSNRFNTCQKPIQRADLVVPIQQFQALCFGFERHGIYTYVLYIFILGSKDLKDKWCKVFRKI